MIHPYEPVPKSRSVRLFCGPSLPEKEFATNRASSTDHSLYGIVLTSCSLMQRREINSCRSSSRSSTWTGYSSIGFPSGAETTLSVEPGCSKQYRTDVLCQHGKPSAGVVKSSRYQNSDETATTTTTTTPPTIVAATMQTDND